MLNGVWVIEKLGLWNWLAEFTPEKNKGFMFSNAQELRAITNCMVEEAPNKVFHSGSSFAFTMRHLKYIATFGYDSYAKNFKDV